MAGFPTGGKSRRPIRIEDAWGRSILDVFFRRAYMVPSAYMWRGGSGSIPLDAITLSVKLKA